MYVHVSQNLCLSGKDNAGAGNKNSHGKVLLCHLVISSLVHVFHEMVTHSIHLQHINPVCFSQVPLGFK